MSMMEVPLENVEQEAEYQRGYRCGLKAKAFEDGYLQAQKDLKAKAFGDGYLQEQQDLDAAMEINAD